MKKMEGRKYNVKLLLKVKKDEFDINKILNKHLKYHLEVRFEVERTGVEGMVMGIS